MAMTIDDHDATLRVQRSGDGSATIYSTRYAQTYHSHHGALSESLYVFVELSGVRERLADGQALNVLEIGLGTGLNLALVLSLARRYQAGLRYDTWEFAPLNGDVLAELHYEDLDAVDPDTWASVRALIARRDTHLDDGPSRRVTPRWRAFEPAELEAECYDAILHDGFSPDANPELWSERALQAMAGALRPGGILTTYTVKGSVRRALKDAGLEVMKVAGPEGGKREVLIAHRR